MIEKEAEDFAMRECCSTCSIKNPYSCKEKCECWTFAKEGVVFGYNKANEWHYPSKGELPNVNQECYFIHSNHYGKGNKPIFTKSNIRVHTGVYTNILDEEGNETTDFCFYDDFIEEEMDISEVYAWKEIVPPKEID